MVSIYLVNDTPTDLALSFRHITNRRINFPKNCSHPLLTTNGVLVLKGPQPRAHGRRTQYSAGLVLLLVACSLTYSCHFSHRNQYRLQLGSSFYGSGVIAFARLHAPHSDEGSIYLDGRTVFSSLDALSKLLDLFLGTKPLPLACQNLFSFFFLSAFFPSFFPSILFYVILIFQSTFPF